MMLTSTLHPFDLNQIVPTPWKNGGGHTREIACWPPGADMDSFGWRVSVATVAQAGPFSVFAGVSRQIMLLKGDGFHLRSDVAQMDQRLDRPWQPFAFSGDAPVDCTLLGGASTDFNVMTRRAGWSSELRIVGGSAAVGATPAGLCMVLAGAWTSADDGRIWMEGQGIWWSEPLADTLLLRAGSSDARLAVVSVRAVT